DRVGTLQHVVAVGRVRHEAASGPHRPRRADPQVVAEVGKPGALPAEHLARDGQFEDGRPGGDGDPNQMPIHVTNLVHIVITATWVVRPPARGSMQAHYREANDDGIPAGRGGDGGTLPAPPGGAR